MNGQHLRALPIEELVPKVGEALTEVGMCNDATGEFAKKAGVLLQGSLELVADVIPQAKDVLAYQVVFWGYRILCRLIGLDPRTLPRCWTICT